MHSSDSPSFTVQGHRGCRGYYPENTLAAFFYAAQLGVHYLELDVVCTGDGQLLVSHDPYMHHEICVRADGSAISEEESHSLNIYRMTTEEIQHFRCGEKGHFRFPMQQRAPSHKPLLKELVDAIHHWPLVRKPRLNIEIKSQSDWDDIFHPQPSAYAAIIAQHLKELELIDTAIVQSFDHRLLNELHALIPNVRSVFLTEDKSRPVLDQLDQLNYTPYGISPHFSLIDEALVKACKEKNLALSAWTVNDQKDMKQLIALGVRNIISDYPDRALAMMY